MKRIKQILGLLGAILLLGYFLKPFAIDKVGGDFDEIKKVISLFHFIPHY